MRRTTKLQTLLVVIALHCVFPALVAVAQNFSYDQETLDLFALYPRSQALDYIAHSHARREELTKSHLVLYSSWFLEGNPKVAMQTTVDDEGKVSRVRSVFDWAEQNSRQSELTAGELKLLLESIKELPRGVESPPLAFVVVVTFQLDGKWQTRLYDRRTPPPQVLKIYQLAHWILDSNWSLN